MYHVAGMGNWREVVAEQVELLARVGLRRVRVTHVGEGLPDVVAIAEQSGVTFDVVRSDVNVLHYETLAMLEIERLAKLTDLPILYMHTKGVSAPHDRGKVHWRREMQRLVVEPWPDNLRRLEAVDAVGYNWLYGRHFSGTFWIAKAAWIRQLPDFAHYHGRHGLTRYTCENWIGAAPGIRVVSLI